MVLISHRGNIDGKNIEFENQPNYIDNAIKLGYDVEIDIWYLEGRLFLGHDTPHYIVDIHWLENRSPQFNYFSHDVDMGVLTSHNYIWSTNLYDRGILVLPEVFGKEPFEGTIGICSDVIESYG